MALFKSKASAVHCCESRNNYLKSQENVWFQTAIDQHNEDHQNYNKDQPWCLCLLFKLHKDNSWFLWASGKELYTLCRCTAQHKSITRAPRYFRQINNKGNLKAKIYFEGSRQWSVFCEAENITCPPRKITLNILHTDPQISNAGEALLTAKIIPLSPPQELSSNMCFEEEV